MKNDIPNHVAIIMDGNGRWATRQGKKRTEGHYAGYKTLKKTALHILSKGVKILSVFAFSTENFKRSQEEVGYLMNLFVSAFKSDMHFFLENNIKVVFSGRKEPLSDEVYDVMKTLEKETLNCTGGIFNVCLNYGGQFEIVDAAKKLATMYKEGEVDLNSVTPENFYSYLYNDLPPVDLMIRTSGELRSSGFLTWQSVYSEYLFLEKYWPDFSEQDFDYVIEKKQKRNRRVGK